MIICNYIMPGRKNDPLSSVGNFSPPTKKGIYDLLTEFTKENLWVTFVVCHFLKNGNGRLKMKKRFTS